MCIRLQRRRCIYSCSQGAATRFCSLDYHIIAILKCTLEVDRFAAFQWREGNSFPFATVPGVVGAHIFPIRTKKDLTSNRNLHLFVRERLQLHDLLRGLSDGEWSAASLDEGWTVEDVVAHIVVREHHVWDLGRAMLFKGTFGPDQG